MTARWRIDYDNDELDGVFDEWWAITDDEKCFVAGSQDEAEWLLAIINEHDKQP